MTVQRFEDLLVWQKSKALAVEIYRVTGSGSFARDFGLRDQIRRAAVSVMSNIAEGFGRFTRPELRRFLTIARGSASEVQSQLYLARELNYLPDATHARLNHHCHELIRMLAALRTSIGTPT